ncbi:TIGR03118 family protein [Sulfuricaulis sp.]
MKIFLTTLQRTLRGGIVIGICLSALVACGRGSGGMSSPGSPSTSGYSAQALVSDKASIPAAHTDANLINPWGIAFAPGGPAWAADEGTSITTVYDGMGAATAPFFVVLPAGSNGNARPTGLVLNTTSDFVITMTSAPALFIFDGLSGTLSAWSPSVSGASLVYDDGAGGAVYKGLALATCSGANFLYATDFHNGKIDTFNGKFQKVSSPGGFVDSTLPAGYAPFGIQDIASTLYVTYAQPLSPSNLEEMTGPGLGVVDVFDTCGKFVKRFATGGVLDAPWGVALAPANFGMFSNDLLLGNFGDGAINAYDPTTGQFIGAMKTLNGTPILYPGLWGITFGNGSANQPSNALFFAAGINQMQDGIFGRIDAASSTTSGAPPSSGNPPPGGY